MSRSAVFLLQKEILDVKKSVVQCLVEEYMKFKNREFSKKETVPVLLALILLIVLLIIPTGYE